MPDLMAHFGAAEPTWYHGTPDERSWQHGARYGIHIGTEQAAREALHARIGRPAEGEWDGTREYGKTLLNRDYGRHEWHPETRTWTRHVDRHPPEYPTGRATYSPDAAGHAAPVPLDARPNVFPVRIKGPMVNPPDKPVTDDYANSRMIGQLRRGQARRGYYYTNISEHEGSVSAVVPSADHLERLDRQQHEGLLAHFAAWDPAVPLYHGSLDKLEKGTMITPESRNPAGSVHSGDYVYATTSPESARYFGMMHDTSPQTDTPVYVHRVEPAGDIEPHNMPGERAEYAHGNYRGRAFRVTGPDRNPAPYTFTSALIAHFAAAVNPHVPEAFANPYHGTSRFGGRPEFSHTWFHGTRGVPEFGERRGDADRMAQKPGEREMTSGWPQPNKLLGVHLSPLHEVAHTFVGSVSSQHGALVHARLNFRNPAHYPTEDHLNLAVAQWADRHYPHWHDDKLNGNMSWSYSDAKGTHRNWHEEHLPGGEPNPHGLSDDELAQRNWGEEDPAHARYFQRVAGHAQQVLQWHPHLPEILRGFTGHLRAQGHRGITYGNQVEGPYDTDAGRGGQASVKAIEKRMDWPSGSPRHISAIADPRDIETTHVEHIAPWREQPEPHERTWEDASDRDEPDEMRDRVLAYHRSRGGEYPREPREPREAARRQASGGDDWDYKDGYVTCDQGHEHWGPHGAAFLLLRHTDEEGTKRYLLQKRTSTGATDHPGTWALPGGALHRGEDSYTGARREAAEEMGPLPRIRHHHTVHDDHGGWFADTHVADAKDKFAPKGGGSTGFEAEGHAWFKQDEISRLRLHPGFRKTWDTVRRSRVDKEAVWDASGSEHSGVYVRFGHWPKDEQSFSPAGGYKEFGVSAYDLDRHGKPAIDHGLDRGHVHDPDWCDEDCQDQLEDPDNDPREEMEGRVHKAERNRYYGEDKPSETAHLVKGDVAGVGYDGEPLLKNVRRVGDWIDHRHLFVPGAERHRLARDPHDEGYEPPKGLGRRKAAAADPPQIPALYHGSKREMQPGEEVAPDHPSATSKGTSGWVYGTPHVTRAYLVAKYKLQEGQPRVYEVAPTGSLHHDPEMKQGESYRSRSPFTVVRELSRDDIHAAMMDRWGRVEGKTAALEVHDYEGTTGDRSHVTRNEYGMIPTSVIARMPGVQGEALGEHRNRQGGEWEDFKRDIAENGIRNPVFITVDHGEEPRLSEGNHRRDAAVELGISHVPAEIRYYGHAEQQGTVLERARHKTGAARSRQYVQRMHVKDLLPYAKLEAYRTDDPGGLRHRHDLAESFRQKGYRPSMHGGMSGDKHYYPPSSPITLVHEDDKSYFEEGHHRVRALDDIGYDKPVPVLVKDFRKTAVIIPGSLPPAQQEGLDVEDLREHRRQMLEVAKNPPPGTRVWRGEVRPSHEDPETAGSAGMHWSANPDSIISGWAPEGHKHVVWQGVVENHAEQAFPRSHPIWRGIHESYGHEAEVRFRPGAHVKLEGAYVHEPKEYPGGRSTTPGYLVPRHPERTHPDWHWHPLDRHIEIRHRGHGAADYSDLGIEREAVTVS